MNPLSQITKKLAAFMGIGTDEAKAAPVPPEQQREAQAAQALYSQVAGATQADYQRAAEQVSMILGAGQQGLRRPMRGMRGLQ